MNKAKYSIFICFFVGFMILIVDSCRNGRTEVNEIRKMLMSNDVDTLIIGCYKAGEANDTSFLPLLIMNLYDPRITHKIQFKGRSVYQQRINALEKITKKNYGKANWQPDSIIIQNWLKWWNGGHYQL